MATDATIPDERAERAPSLPFPLQQNETVLRVCKRHWLYLWPRSILYALLGVVPPTIVAVVLASLDWYDGITARIFWVAAALWLLYWGVRVFLNWYRYHHDLWVITNQRIVDCQKSNPFHLKLATADLVNVQDMFVERSGILRTMLNYGDIVCQTASEGAGEFRLSGIPDPSEVQLLVDRERDRERLRR